VILVHLRVFSLKRPTAGASVAPFRVLRLKKTKNSGSERKL